MSHVSETILVVLLVLIFVIAIIVGFRRNGKSCLDPSMGTPQKPGVEYADANKKDNLTPIRRIKGDHVNDVLNYETPANVTDMVDEPNQVIMTQAGLRDGVAPLKTQNGTVVGATTDNYHGSKLTPESFTVFEDSPSDGTVISWSESQKADRPFAHTLQVDLKTQQMFILNGYELLQANIL